MSYVKVSRVYRHKLEWTCAHTAVIECFAVDESIGLHPAFGLGCKKFPLSKVIREVRPVEMHVDRHVCIDVR